MRLLPAWLLSLVVFAAHEKRRQPANGYDDGGGGGASLRVFWRLSHVGSDARGNDHCNLTSSGWLDLSNIRRRRRATQLVVLEWLAFALAFASAFERNDMQY